MHVAQLSASTDASARTSRRPHGDVGVILVSTLTKLVLVLAVVGTIGYDTFSILTTQYRVRDDVLGAAQLANQVLHDGHTAQAATAAVRKYAADHGDVVVHQGPVTGRKNGWTVELRREAHTIAASYVPKAKNYVVASSTATASDELSAT